MIDISKIKTLEVPGSQEGDILIVLQKRDFDRLVQDYEKLLASLKA